MKIPMMGSLTFGFLLAKETLCHLGEELLCRAGWVELRYHHTCIGWKFVWSESLGKKFRSQDVMYFKDGLHLGLN